MFPNLHAIKVKKIGPTSKRGARIRMYSCRHPGDRITIPFDYEARDMVVTAANYLTKHGFNVIAAAPTTDDFDLLLVQEMVAMNSRIVK